MKIHQIRNATVVIEAAGQRILVDPMLGPVGSLTPYSFIRFRARRNPLIELPPNTDALMRGITAGLITHTHFGMDCDHLDAVGAKALAGVPVYCHAPDEAGLRKRGLETVALQIGRESPFPGGTITPVAASHGGCVMSKVMGPGAGYVLRLTGEPSLYLTGDTILTPEVRAVLADMRPDVCLLPCGSAQLDVGGPVLMPTDEILEFVSLAPGRVICNHLEALNHCPTTRDMLRSLLREAGLDVKVTIPADGSVVEIS